MDYLVELRVGGSSKLTNQGKQLFVRVHAANEEDAVDKAESAWGYDAVSVGETPDVPTSHSGHSRIGKYRKAVEKVTTTVIGEDL